MRFYFWRLSGACRRRTPRRRSKRRVASERARSSPSACPEKSPKNRTNMKVCARAGACVHARASVHTVVRKMLPMLCAERVFFLCLFFSEQCRRRTPRARLHLQHGAALTPTRLSAPFRIGSSISGAELCPNPAAYHGVQLSWIVPAFGHPRKKQSASAPPESEAGCGDAAGSGHPEYRCEFEHCRERSASGAGARRRHAPDFF